MATQYCMRFEAFGDVTVVHYNHRVALDEAMVNRKEEHSSTNTEIPGKPKRRETGSLSSTKTTTICILFNTSLLSLP